jgi:hypothetical protein
VAPLALALGLAAACRDTAILAPAPLDRFLFPTGIAVRHLPDGRAQLLVVSSNYDLRYDTGTLLSIDPDASGDALQGNPFLVRYDHALVSSFGGELKVAEAAACGLPQSLAVTASRQAIEADFFSLEPDGKLTCGDLCRVPLDSSYADAYGVVIACSTAFARTSAFFTYLRGPAGEGRTTEILLPLAGSGQVAQTFYDLGLGLARSGAYDPRTSRLFLTPNGTVLADPLRWLELVTPIAPGASGTFPTHSYDLYPPVNGSEARGIALSSDGTRLYLTLLIYDAAQAASTGAVIIEGAALAILDIRPDASGTTLPQLLKLVPLEAGASEIQVIGRPGRPDLLAIACPDAGSLALYDDDVGQVVKVFGTGGDGVPQLGKQPFGMALEEQPAAACGQVTSNCVRLFVAAFESGVVNVLEIDREQPWNAARVKVLGAAQ